MNKQALDIIHLSQWIVQGCSDGDSTLLQIPGIDKDVQQHLESCGVKKKRGKKQFWGNFFFFKRNFKKNLSTCGEFEENNSSSGVEKKWKNKKKKR